MKKIILLLMVFALAFVLVSCGQSEDPGTSDDTIPPAESETPENPEEPEKPEEPEVPIDPKDCTHVYEVVDKVRPLAHKEGKATYKCNICKDSYTETLPKTNSLKILAIGNSFSVDATTYLWSICRASGIENLVIGCAQVGGSSLDNHASYISSGASHYEYTKYTSEYGDIRSGVTLNTALLDEDWDFITIQQLSSAAGKPDTYSNIDSIIKHISVMCPDADIYWHMTWAYQEGITKAGYEYYNNDQLTMYNAIVDTVKEKILTNPAIKGVIPAGTTLQNIRTSRYGDNVTRDGSHAGYGVGRFAVALTWYAIFTGGSTSSVKWNTTQYQVDVKGCRAVIDEAVKNALKKPYEITQSKYTD